MKKERGWVNRHVRTMVFNQSNFHGRGLVRVPPVSLINFHAGVELNLKFDASGISYRKSPMSVEFFLITCYNNDTEMRCWEGFPAPLIF